MSAEIRVLVHVPKTAGTSFRLALEEELGTEAMVYDYGPASEVTSEVVRRHIHAGDEPDDEAFAAELRAGPARIVCGHFPATRYRDLFGAANTLVFLREPIQRLVSEFRHYVAHNGFTGSFEDFFRNPYFTNRQMGYLDGIDLAGYGFVGITEQYERSLALANERFGWRLRNLAMNLSRPNLAVEYTLKGDGVRELVERNADDLAFYAEALALFESRATGAGEAASVRRDRR